MDAPHEIELKFDIDPDAAIDATAFPGVDDGRSAMISTYFDTPDHDLLDAGFALRVRAIGDRRIQTIKAGDGASAGLFVRPEWEFDIDGDTPDWDAADGLLSKRFPDDVRARVEPVFTTRIARQVRTVRGDHGEIELALDEGEVWSENRVAPLREIELELKSGDPAGLFDLARRIDETVPLRLGVRSKAERGYGLAEDESRDAIKAESITLDPEATACDAFASIAQACIRQFRLNEALLMTSGAAEPLHQARVGLRRLRSAFSLFKPLFEGDARADLLRAELKWLAAELGEVRNLDVLLPRVDGDTRRRLKTARAQGWKHVRIEVGSARTRLLMIDLMEWLMLGQWRVAPASTERAERPIRKTAALILADRRHRVKKRGRRLAHLDHGKRHKVRIEAKKLRYATEFFASLYAAPKAARHRHKIFLASIEALQDELGELNDRVTAPRVLARLGIDAEVPHASRSAGKVLHQAEGAHDELIAAKRFWR